MRGDGIIRSCGKRANLRRKRRIVRVVRIAPNERKALVARKMLNNQVCTAAGELRPMPGRAGAGGCESGTRKGQADRERCRIFRSPNRAVGEDSDTARAGRYFAGASRSASTASSVSFAAVTPMRSKHSATMLLGVVKSVMSRSIGVMALR